MNPVREAIVLPAIFLTVILCGGFRLGAAVSLVPPSLTALVLGVPLVGLLVRSGAIAVHALLHGSRSALENLSGAVVLATVFVAAAQAINLVLPDAGLLHAAFAIFVFCQLLTIGAGRMDRVATLRALLVLFGSLFVLRFIVVEALYAPGGGMLQRVLTTLMSGASLGGISYQPNAPATGYVAFFTLVLFFVGLILLPRPLTLALVRQSGPPGHALRSTFSLMLMAGLAASMACRQKADHGSEAHSATASASSPKRAGLVTAAQRTAGLRAARVWQPPPVSISQAALGSNPSGPGAFDEDDVLECRLIVRGMGGTTPKFDCELSGHDVVRVKYGRGNPELHAEIAATRLLSALGFGADRMSVVKKVRCAGCTVFPYQSLKCLAETGLEKACFPGGIDYGSVSEFEHVSIERRLDGRRIESTPDQGWAWYEIDQMDARAGGSPRAHVDALKLMAVVIAHWDNKAENQRLLCLPGGDLPDGGCSKPFAIVQDLGASFGPTKLDLHNWRSTPVWVDPRSCLVSMKHMPWGGATFPDQRISEEGRQFLLSLFGQLSAAQLRDLFAGARVEASEGITAEGRQPAAWAAAFLDKVRQVREAGPCPASPTREKAEGRRENALPVTTRADSRS